MNSYERVMATLTGHAVDRPAVLAVLGAYGGRLTGVPLRKLYSDVDAYVAGQVAVQTAFGVDMVLAPFDLSAIAEAFGGTPIYHRHQAPNMRRPGALSIEHAIDRPLPDIRTSGRLPMALEACRLLSARYRGQVPLFAVIPGPAALPVLLMGMENWVDALLFHENQAQQLLEYSATFWLAWSSALLGAGADGLVVAEAMASAEVSTPELFVDRLLPHIRTCFGALEAPLVFHHGGGRINWMLSHLSEMPNMVGVGLSSKDDLSEARRALGPGPAILGNLDNLSFPATNAQGMYALARDCLQEGLSVGPFLLCNAGADIPTDTDPETIRAMVRAAEDLG